MLVEVKCPCCEDSYFINITLDLYWVTKKVGTVGKKIFQVEVDNVEVTDAFPLEVVLANL